MANLNLKAGDNITLVKDGDDLEISSHQDETSEIIVSPTEPNTGEEVWVKKGKNLFNYSSANMDNVGFTSSTGEISSESNLTRLTQKNGLLLKSGTYTLSFNTLNSYWILVYGTDGNYKQNYIQSSWIDSNTGTFTLQEDNIIRISLRYSDNANVTIQNYNIQIEQNSSATIYEAYVDKKIYTKNDNGVYEEFYDETKKDIYSTAEIRIGTWIDGKPLYRKVIESTTNSTATEKNIICANNVNEITKWCGDIVFSNNSKLPLNYYIDSSNFSVAYNDISNSNGRIRITTTQLSKPIIIIIEYTKTTY